MWTVTWPDGRGQPWVRQYRRPFPQPCRSGTTSAPGHDDERFDLPAAVNRGQPYGVREQYRASQSDDCRVEPEHRERGERGHQQVRPATQHHGRCDAEQHVPSVPPPSAVRTPSTVTPRTSSRARSGKCARRGEHPAPEEIERR